MFFNPDKTNLSFSVGTSGFPASGSRRLASSIAGAWYPGDPGELDKFLTAKLAGVPGDRSGQIPNILILPHAGYPYSAACAMYGIKRIMNASFKRVVLLAPSHRTYLKDIICAPEADAVGTPFGDVAIDRGALEQLSGLVDVQFSDAVHRGEHSTQIQYPMLQYALKEFKLVPLIVGEFSEAFAARCATALRSIIDRDTLLVISSDFTHYGRDFDFQPFDCDAVERTAELDAGACKFILQGDADGFTDYVRRTGATICGRNPIALALRTLPSGTRLEKLHYCTSSDDSGEARRFVCYCCIAGHADWAGPKAADFLTPADRKALLGIARRSIAHGLETGMPYPADFFASEASEAMRTVAGCFVTLSMKDSGHLRGCIGEIQGRRPLYQGVADRAFDAAFRDPRFPRLLPDEFDLVELEISVLTPERPVDSWHDIEIGRHGMTVNKYGHSAVFLPQVAPEQRWNLAETLTHLCLKAGLAPDDWQRDTRFTVFEAIVFNESQL